MREISLDTETTGLDVNRGDRIVEIGCVELFNHVPTGHTFHEYIDPQRPMSVEATQITGITDEMLQGKPLFKHVAQKFVDFIGDDVLVIHNAAFDMRFINAELAAVGLGPVPNDQVVDTLRMAKKKFPGAQATLDALCRRFGIDNSSREKHGALLDAELLADVYLELIGGRQPDFALGGGAKAAATSAPSRQTAPRQGRSVRHTRRLSGDEAAAHRAFVEELGGDSPWSALLDEAFYAARQGDKSA